MYQNYYSMQLSGCSLPSSADIPPGWLIREVVQPIHTYRRRDSDMGRTEQIQLNV